MPDVLLWLRRDLRLHDLPALLAAADAADGGRVLPVFVLDPRLLGRSPVRDACLIDALTRVTDSYDDALVLRHGRPENVIPDLARSIGAHSVHITSDAAPFGVRRDEAVAARLDGVPLMRTGSSYAVGPGRVHTATNTPYKVFTPYARAWREHGWRTPATVPTGLRWMRTVETDDLPKRPDISADLPEVGEQSALERWARFREDIDTYDEDRDRPDLDATSRLSVDLKWGTIHPRTLLADLRGRTGAGVERFVTELAWREFYADVLWHNPESAWHDLRPMPDMAYDDPDTDPAVADAVDAWREGRTGYPLVDAGMRQLAAQGWMHNRVRMVTASFLVKHLHVWWPVGARWFLDQLADGDVASNNHGWQWVAGTGTDAAPYFRIFNPTTQGEKFDPNGEYVRRWVPELRGVTGRAVHKGAAAPGARGYPQPIVDHREARSEALLRYETSRRG